MEIINGQLHSESIARVSVSEVGDAREVITMGEGWNWWNGSTDRGLPFCAEGSSGYPEVYFTGSAGNSIAWDKITASAEG